MFVPDYQIHNILKEFTRRLRNGSRRPGAGYQMKNVVRKVAGTITNRVMHLGEEEARRRRRTLPPGDPLRPVEPRHRQAGTFHYQILDRDRRKTPKSLAVEDSQKLIERFRTIMEERAGSDPS